MVKTTSYSHLFLTVTMYGGEYIFLNSVRFCMYIKHRLLNVLFNSSMSSLVFYLANQPQKEVWWNFPLRWQICHFLPAALSVFLVILVFYYTSARTESLCFLGEWQILNHFVIIFRFFNRFTNHCVIVYTDSPDVYSLGGINPLAFLFLLHIGPHSLVCSVTFSL